MDKQAHYFDFAATTNLSGPVAEVIAQAAQGNWGNASGLHQAAQKSAAAISNARRSLSKILGVQPSEIIFTSGGSESNNLSLKGQVIHFNSQGIIPHILSSKLEHASVVKTLEQMENLGWAKVDWVRANKSGTPDLTDLKQKITPETKLAAFMAVSNETGAIFPIAEISALLIDSNIKLHIDAVQAGLTIDLKPLVAASGSLSLSGHKIYGPKGIGLLIKKKNIELTPLITGGSQEQALRAGTENPPAILGFTKALELAQGSIKENTSHFAVLQNILIGGLKEKLPKVKFLSEGLSSSHILSFLLLPLDANRILRKLDAKGYQLASGSACSTGNPAPSEPLLAMGYSPDEAKSLIRVSFGLTSTEQEVKNLITAITEVANG